MNTQNTESDQSVENGFEHAESINKSGNSCWGPAMSEADEMMKNCPCASLFQGSTVSPVIPIAAAGLLFSIALTGWVLGVAAFLRTI